MIIRRLLAMLGSVVLLSSTHPDLAHGDPAWAWQYVPPAEAGFSPDIGETLDDAVRTSAFVNLHSVIVARNGKLVLERYYEGADEKRGQPLGSVKFGPEVLHDLRSVTKSIVGLLYGIALADGEVSDLNQSLIGQFPDYQDLAADPKRQRITVAHALSMTLGMAWYEDLPYTDPRNSETAMDMADDRYRYVLGQPVVAEPGRQWSYNGGATALLGRLISRGTGQPLDDYARKKLFDPLGINDVEWMKAPDGEPLAASGLRMRPRDLARIGQLILDRGRWGTLQVVPVEWLDQSFTPSVRLNDDVEYGYHWWLGRLRGSDQQWIGAFGNGGQRLFVIPSFQMIVVITAGNYNKPDQRDLPIAVMGEVIMPALRDR